MRTELSELDGEHEVLRCLRRPRLDLRLGWQPVEPVVDLHRAESAGVQAKPITRRRLRRIDGTAPVLVGPPRTADVAAATRSWGMSLPVSHLRSWYPIAGIAIRRQVFG